jgi:hypothetical protein
MNGYTPVPPRHIDGLATSAGRFRHPGIDRAGENRTPGDAELIEVSPGRMLRRRTFHWVTASR